MLTNIPGWASCGFSLPSTRSGALLLWPRKLKMISEDARSMWKIFVALKKGQLVLMVWHAAEATGSLCWSQCECVCVRAREHVWSGSVRHTCFPVGWIWWGPQGKEQTNSSESSSQGVRYPRVQCCSCRACSGRHDGLQVDGQTASQREELQPACSALQSCCAIAESKLYQLSSQSYCC